MVSVCTFLQTQLERDEETMQRTVRIIIAQSWISSIVGSGRLGESVGFQKTLVALGTVCVSVMFSAISDKGRRVTLRQD